MSALAYDVVPGAQHGVSDWGLILAFGYFALSTVRPDDAIVHGMFETYGVIGEGEWTDHRRRPAQLTCPVGIRGPALAMLP